MKNVVLTDGFMAAKHVDLGISYQRQNMLYEALFEYEAALLLTPDDKYAHWNRATTLLSLGEYAEGFLEHEWAWKLFDWRGFGPIQGDMDRLIHLPLWRGEDISDKRLLVYHELGFGDAIQTMRYLPELKRRSSHVTLVINSELVALSEQFGIEVVDKLPLDISGYAYRLPFFGVMRVLRQTLQNIPGEPYLDVKWRRRKNHVGICWSGRTQTAFTLEYFLSMFEHDRFELHSLQLGPASDVVSPLNVKQFADTVDVISQMDHIITIDSAPAHLAGAVGHPSTHLLLPFLSDWRWWYTTAWYPCIKTYRQHSVDNWATPFARLNEALRE